MIMSQRKKADKPANLEIYFDARDGSYWFNLNGRFVALGKTDLFLHLRKDYELTDVLKDGIRELDWPLYKAQTERMIDYAGALAGHRAGTFTDGSGRKYLVTDEAHGVFDDLPKEVPKFFPDFITELLPAGQHEFACQWLAIALRSLRKGDFRPGQVCIFAGAAGCGKSLLQQIITEILGGRSSNPFRYMMELTQFNKDLCGAEHWQIEDPATSIDMRTRRAFGAKLKEATVNRDFSIHAKGKDALTLPLFRRVTISVNDEPENLAVCPPLDPSIQDKVFLFHCGKAEKCFEPFRDKGGEVDRQGVWLAVMKEIHAVRAWLLREFPAKAIPKDYRDDRFGVRAWHHPELLNELAAMAKETRLLQLVDEAFYPKRKDDDCDIYVEKIGSSSELEKELRKSEIGFQFEKLLSFVGEFGSLLGKLAKSQPKRVSKKLSGGYATWTIHPPATTKE